AVLAVAGAGGEVALAPLAVIGAAGVEAAERAQVVVHRQTSGGGGRSTAAVIESPRQPFNTLRTRPTFQRSWDRNRVELVEPDLFRRHPELEGRTFRLAPADGGGSGVSE